MSTDPTAASRTGDSDDATHTFAAPAEGEGVEIGHRHEMLAAAPGAEIGPYKIVRQLGEGGMGAVYLAGQLQPIRRDVALKIIKPGMDSRQVISRFESERQTLALMDHPNIAASSMPAPPRPGCRYFVMELVNGIPITDYCDSKRLTVKDRSRCSSRFATPSSTRTRKASSTATSSRRTSWWPNRRASRFLR